MALFTATIFALQLATQKLAALDPSKTAKEWQDFLMGEAMEQILHNEEVGLLEETTDLESP